MEIQKLDPGPMELRSGTTINNLRGVDVNLFQMKQNPDETIENYLARVCQTTNEYEIPKHLLIGMTVQGLKSEVRKNVMPQKPETLEQLREIAVIAERTVKSKESLSENFAVSLRHMEEMLM